MNNLQLKLRMAVVGTLLFGFYVLAAFFLAEVLPFGIVPILAIGVVLIPAVQYKLGRWMAVRSVGAEDMPESGRYQEVHHMTEKLCRDMNLEKPRLMVAEMGVPNAFATGRRGAGIVVVSTELMQILERDELEGVIAHELAHLDNRDTVMMVIGSSIGIVVGYAAMFAVRAMGENNIATFILSYVALLAAQFLVQLFILALSRYREYVADEDASQAIGSGEPLARALEKLSQAGEGRESAVDDNVSAMCIVNSDRSLMQRILATHPPMEKRIGRLRN